MPNAFNRNTFSDTYNDDFRDSDNYYKVLFNNGRALQQRELNQLQTILQQQITSLATYTFSGYGKSVTGGRIGDARVPYIKLDSSFPLPDDPTVLENTILEEADTGVKFNVIKVVEAVVDSGGAEVVPPVIYGRYVDENQQSPADETIVIAQQGVKNLSSSVAGVTDLRPIATNTALNPRTGTGTLFTVDLGTFFVNDFIVFTGNQSIVLQKFNDEGSAFNGNVGFKVVQDIVTVNDDQDLYDNSGANLNLAAPGADRFRIRLTLIKEADIDATEQFIVLASLVNGRMDRNFSILDPAIGRLGAELRARWFETHGNYVDENFKINFQTSRDSAGDSISDKLDVVLGSGSAYVEGRRFGFLQSSRLQVDKPRATKTLTNVSSSAFYGNYFVVESAIGVPDVNTNETLNIRDAVAYGGSTRGTCKVRGYEKFGSTQWKIFVYDVKMNSGFNIGAMRSIGNGSGTGDFYANLARTTQPNGSKIAILHDALNNNVFFTLPNDRPEKLEDISLTTQFRITGTSDGAGNLTVSAPSTGYSSLEDVSTWIITRDDNGATVTTDVSASSSTSVTFQNLPTSQALTILSYQGKTGAVRSKSLVTNSAAFTPAADGTITLTHQDIYSLTSVVDDTTSLDITDRYNLDNGQRDNFYDVGRLKLKNGQTAPASTATVTYRYFAHGTGDFFTAQSYTGAVAYEDIPSHRQNNGELIPLIDVMDFRPRMSSAGSIVSGSVNELPRNGDLIQFDEVIYLGIKGRVIVSNDGIRTVQLGIDDADPKYPMPPSTNHLELARFHLYPYMLNDQDMSVFFNDNRRYTMRDIGKIDKQLGELKELTSLTLLELETAGITVLDSDGRDRFKSGITADRFVNHAFSDTELGDYRASIDMAEGVVRPPVIERENSLIYDSDLSFKTILIGDTVYFEHDQVEYISNTQASQRTIIQPFPLPSIIGTVTISPSSDNWRDFQQAPDVYKPTVNIINTSKTYGTWNYNWSGLNESQLSKLEKGKIVQKQDVLGGTYIQGNREYRKKDTEEHYISNISTRTEKIGNFVINNESIPYARTRFISYKFENLRPNTQHFVFLDGVNITNFVFATSGTSSFTRKATLSKDSPYLYAASRNSKYRTATEFPTKLGGKQDIITDSNGAVSGWIMIPNNPTTGLQFKTKTKLKLEIIDINTYKPDDALSYASTTYIADGILTTKQNQYETTRTITFASRTIPAPPEFIKYHYPYREEEGSGGWAEGDSVGADGGVAGPGSTGSTDTGGDPEGGTVSCLTENMMVLLNGKIEFVTKARVGDRIGATIITDVIHNHLREGYYIINGELEITNDHPVLVDNNWKRVEELSIGDNISGIEIFSIDYIPGLTQTVYIETSTDRFDVYCNNNTYTVHGRYRDFVEKAA